MNNAANKKIFLPLAIIAGIGFGLSMSGQSHAYALDNTPVITYQTKSSSDNAKTAESEGSTLAESSDTTSSQAKEAVDTGTKTTSTETKAANSDVKSASSNMNSQVANIVGSAEGSSSSPTYSTHTGNPLQNVFNNIKNGGIWLISNGLGLAWIVAFVVFVYGLFRTMWGAISKKSSPKDGVIVMIVSIVMLVVIGSIQWIPGAATWIETFLKGLFS